MNSEYGFKLKKMVNNLDSNNVLSDQINECKHIISNTNFCDEAINFYGENSKWLVELAEENINTVADLNNYIGWISNDEQGN